MSWLLLRGRCRHCHTHISARYPAVEVGTAALFALAGWFFGLSWELPAFLYLAAISIALALIDVDVHRLPNAIVLPSYAVAGIMLGGACVLRGEPGVILRVLLGGLALYAFYLALVMIYPSGMGFGDVKLAGVLGMNLAFLGWPALVVGAFLAFLLGGVVGAALMLTRNAGRKSRIPFGPYMLIGGWVGILFGDGLADWYLGFMGLGQT